MPLAFFRTRTGIFMIYIHYFYSQEYVYENKITKITGLRKEIPDTYGNKTTVTYYIFYLMLIDSIFTSTNRYLSGNSSFPCGSHMMLSFLVNT